MKRLLALLLIAGCSGSANQGTETGNPKATINARVGAGAHTTNATAVSLGGGAGQIDVDGAWLWLEGLSLERQRACDGDQEEDEADDREVDQLLSLLGGTGLVLEQLQPGTYCRIELDLAAPADAPTTAPPILGAATLVVEGTLSTGEAFQITSSDSSSWSLEGSFRLDSTMPAVLVGLDAAGWFDELDLAGLPTVDGVLLLDRDTDSDQLDRFESNLDQSIALYRDSDADGWLDLTELEAPIASIPE